MLLIQCVTAYTAITALAQQSMDYKTALALVLLKKRLAPHAEFYAQKERELVETYAKRSETGEIIMDGPNRFALDSDKDLAEYNRKRQELASAQIPEEITPVKASGIDRITPAHLEALEGFVEFGEDDI